MTTPMEVMPHELMIGNYVQYNPKAVDEGTQIVPIKIAFIDCRNEPLIALDEPFDNYYYPSELQPIPLTEKWLEDLGFKLTYNSDMRKTYDLEVNNTLFEFVFPQDGGRTKFRASSIVWDAEIFVPYVHTLQNFVFAFCKHKLTGTHLTTTA